MNMKKIDIDIKKEIEAFNGEHPEFNELFYRAIENDDIDLAANLTVSLIKGLSTEAMVKICMFMDAVSDRAKEVYFTGHDEEFNKKMDEMVDLIEKLEDEEYEEDEG